MANTPAAFMMRVEERVVPLGVPDVVIAGPWLRGSCRQGDKLRLTGPGVNLSVTCLGVELLNWGRSRQGWVSVRVADVGLEDVRAVDLAQSVGW